MKIHWAYHTYIPAYSNENRRGMSELKFKKLRLLHAARLRRLHFWLSSHWGTLLPSTVCPASQNCRPAEYCDTSTCIIATDHFNMALFDVRMYMEKCIPGTRTVPWLRRLTVDPLVPQSRDILVVSPHRHEQQQHTRDDIYMPNAITIIKWWMMRRERGGEHVSKW
jgi:hypothetical protein